MYAKTKEDERFEDLLVAQRELDMVHIMNLRKTVEALETERENLQAMILDLGIRRHRLTRLLFEAAYGGEMLYRPAYLSLIRDSGLLEGYRIFCRKIEEEKDHEYPGCI